MEWILFYKLHRNRYFTIISIYNSIKTDKNQYKNQLNTQNTLHIEQDRNECNKSIKQMQNELTHRMNDESAKNKELLNKYNNKKRGINKSD